MDAGCPSSGVLFHIKRKTKLRFKYAVRRIIRQQHYIKRTQLANSFNRKQTKDFWASVKRQTRRNVLSSTNVIDGVSGNNYIAEYFGLQSLVISSTHITILVMS